MCCFVLSTPKSLDSKLTSVCFVVLHCCCFHSHVIHVILKVPDFLIAGFGIVFVFIDVICVIHRVIHVIHKISHLTHASVHVMHAVINCLPVLHEVLVFPIEKVMVSSSDMSICCLTTCDL